MSPIVIVVLVGIPGAGKTTFSNQCKQYFHDCVVTIFHYDKLCKSFSCEERKLVVQQVDDFVLKLNDSQTENDRPNIIIIDDNNYYKSMCYEYMKLCRKYNLGFIVVHLKISLEKAIEQNLARNVSEQIPERIIQDMLEKLEIPKVDHVLRIDVEEMRDFNLDFVRENVEIAWKCPLSEVERPRGLRMSISRLQNVDLTLRKIVHQKILENNNRAQEYNRIKKDLFKRIRSGEVNIAFFDSHDYICESHSGQLQEELLKFFI